MSKPLLYREYEDFINAARDHEVVLYNTGGAATVIQAVRDKVKISHVVCDDFWQWNTKIEGMEIKSPHSLKDKAYVVLITQPYYAFAVEQTLAKLGVNNYFCYGFFSENLKKSYKIGYGGRFIQGRTFLQAGRDNSRLIVSLTNNCNLCCPFCAVRYNRYIKKPDMPLENYIKLLDDVKGLWCRGRLVDTVQMDGVRELFAYPQYKAAIIETAKRRFNIYLVTNGVMLTPENSRLLLENGMNEILISVCGISPEVYVQHQGFNERDDSLEFAGRQLDRVKHNVQELVRQRNELGKQCAIGISYLVDDQSCGEMKDAIMYWRNVGVDFIWGSALAKVAEDGTIIERHENSNQAVPRERCFQLWVSSDGNLAPCYGPECTAEKIDLGNVFDTPIYDLVNSDKFNKFHENLATRDPQKVHPLCATCPSSGLVK